STDESYDPGTCKTNVFKVKSDWHKALECYEKSAEMDYVKEVIEVGCKIDDIDETNDECADERSR
ncbi:25649_t:CDS:1, partial [Racocetra persica]